MLLEGIFVTTLIIWFDSVVNVELLFVFEVMEQYFLQFLTLNVNNNFAKILCDRCWIKLQGRTKVLADFKIRTNYLLQT